MAILTMMKSIKELHKEEIVFLKVGTFYSAYDKDAYIVAYLLNYNVTEIEGIKKCGFPCNSIYKIKEILEKEKISYLLLDKADDYEIREKKKEKENRYMKVYNKAKTYVNLKIRVQKINEILISKMDTKEIRSKVKAIEDILV